MYSLKKLILWTFKISSQIKHELMTLLTTAEAEDTRQTSIDRRCSCSFAEENRQNVGCTSSSRGLNLRFSMLVHFFHSHRMNGESSRLGNGPLRDWTTFFDTV